MLHKLIHRKRVEVKMREGEAPQDERGLSSVRRVAYLLVALTSVWANQSPSTGRRSIGLCLHSPE